MFNRLLASIGIGSATIDTLLEKTHYTQGEEVEGIIRIRGGNVQQDISTIHLTLMTEYIRESNDHKYKEQTAIRRFAVSQPFRLEAGETREVPFAFRLPAETPLTFRNVPVWVKTELEIVGAVDPTDNDRIEVLPGYAQNVVLEAIDQLGFRLRKADCEYSRHSGTGLPFVQELEFVPTTHFRGDLDELEVVFRPAAGGVELLLQIDRRARGFASLFAEALDMDESFVRVRFSEAELDRGASSVAYQLKDIIARYRR
ncbi:sporulation protein [Paenibacillus thailandensis]|uniref:Sporulation protein n=1 Tax=Paenibacillus thailandensis TaxID=393250 RepID=A0ABW5QZZ8_9BACL